MKIDKSIKHSKKSIELLKQELEKTEFTKYEIISNFFKEKGIKNVSITTLENIDIEKLENLITSADIRQVESVSIWINDMNHKTGIVIDFKDATRTMSNGKPKKYFMLQENFFKAIENMGFYIELFHCEGTQIRGIRLYSMLYSDFNTEMIGVQTHVNNENQKVENEKW